MYFLRYVYLIRSLFLSLCRYVVISSLFVFHSVCIYYLYLVSSVFLFVYMSFVLYFFIS